MSMETATFGAGCFWGVEVAFRQISGVALTTVGYQGGDLAYPDYEDVCTGRTGHAEVVQIRFDPSIVDYERLLDVFWKCHDPTTANRQGADVGTQYRSIIFYGSDEQKMQAEKSRDDMTASGKFRKDIVTEIVRATDFFPAEEYHQQYLEKRGS